MAMPDCLRIMLDLRVTEADDAEEEGAWINTAVAVAAADNGEAAADDDAWEDVVVETLVELLL